VIIYHNLVVVAAYIYTPRLEAPYSKETNTIEELKTVDLQEADLTRNPNL
jgi:hypothetical protein